MITKFYLPLLKSKAGEFSALSSLTPNCKSKIVPLFEVTPIEFDHDSNAKPKTLKEHLANFCNKIIKKWPSSNCFIDTDLIEGQDVEGVDGINFIYKQITAKGIYPTPIVKVLAKKDLIDSVNSIRTTYPITDIGIRITINDVTSSSFAENLTALLNSLNTTENNCHIIFDLKDSDFSQKEDFSEAILDVLKEFPTLQEWKSFTLVGGSFPGMGKIKTDTPIIPRSDWMFYNYFIERLSKEVFSRQINYGDYSIVAPGYFEFDPRKMTRSANIRYTHDNIWFVAKGKALKKSADWQQYFALAKKVVDSKYFLGQNYSTGDLHVKKCADKKTTTGNSNTWMSVGNNHHFTKVVNDLFAKTP